MTYFSGHEKPSSASDAAPHPGPSSHERLTQATGVREVQNFRSARQQLRHLSKFDKTHAENILQHLEHINELELEAEFVRFGEAITVLKRSCKSILRIDEELRANGYSGFTVALDTAGGVLNGGSLGSAGAVGGGVIGLVRSLNSESARSSERERDWKFRLAEARQDAVDAWSKADVLSRQLEERYLRPGQ